VYVTNYSWLYLVGIKYAHIQKKLEQMVGVAETRTLMLQLHNTISYIPPSSIEVLLGQSVGNSVSYDDTSVFTIIQQSKTKQSIEGIVKALAVPAWKQSTLINLCQQLQKLEHLREQARWGGVRLMQYVRAGLADISSYDALPHVKISELLTCSVDQSVCSDRRTSFVGNKNVLLPTVIASFVQTESEKQTYGVSSGSCTGTLVTHEQLQHLPEGDYILVVATLSPDLAQYLPKVVGVISRNGGLLSHMAIVAREAKVPVVISSRYLKLGSRVYLNGETGEVAS
jgi:phosphohistidine swiveling domain-containing protein